jgi:hypothetical protein
MISTGHSAGNVGYELHIELGLFGFILSSAPEAHQLSQS